MRVPGKGVRHGSYCHACNNGSANVAGDRYGPCDPYHYLVECTAAACATARIRVLPLVRSIVEAIACGAEHIMQCVPDNATAHLQPLADAVVAALPAADSGLWMATITGRTIVTRLSFGHPWSASDLPSTVRGSQTPIDVLATSMGCLFDAMTWPSYLTRTMSATWAARANRIQRICNDVRDSTHPAALLPLRRGGARNDNAAAAAAAGRSEEDRAAVNAAAAAPSLPALADSGPRRSARIANARCASTDSGSDGSWVSFGSDDDDSASSVSTYVSTSSS